MQSNSRQITSNQSAIHDDLIGVIKKHCQRPFQKPLQTHNIETFKKLDSIITQHNLPIILDSGCGTGESTINLGLLYPDNVIVGIDKSEKRLSRYIDNNSIIEIDNVILARGDVIDLWRLMKLHAWPIKKHYLLYPNPWPKKEHLKRRWHGHPVFPEMIQLADEIELRTNWKIYAEEFKKALELAGLTAVLDNLIEPYKAISPFEKKYIESGHLLYLCKN